VSVELSPAWSDTAGVDGVADVAGDLCTADMLGGVSTTNPPPDFNGPLQTSTYNQPDQSSLDELTQTACFTALNKASEITGCVQESRRYLPQKPSY